MLINSTRTSARPEGRTDNRTIKELRITRTQTHGSLTSPRRQLSFQDSGTDAIPNSVLLLSFSGTCDIQRSPFRRTTTMYVQVFAYPWPTSLFPSCATTTTAAAETDPPKADLACTAWQTAVPLAAKGVRCRSPRHHCGDSQSDDGGGSQAGQAASMGQPVVILSKYILSFGFPTDALMVFLVRSIFQKVPISCLYLN